MSTAATGPTTFGRDLGEAEQAIRRLLNVQLDREHTSFEVWVVMNLLANQRPIDRGALEDDLAGRLQTDRKHANGLVDQTLGDGLIQIAPTPGGNGRSSIELTSEGRARFASLREAVARTTTDLLTGLAPDDVETTRRTLRAVNERARSMLDG